MKAVKLFICVLLISHCYSFPLRSLDNLKIDASSVSVSGLSSGGFFSTQVHVALSKSIAHSAVVAGGPYYCAQGQSVIALTECMKFPQSISVEELQAVVTKYAAAGSIDDPSNMKNSKIFVEHGTKDSVVAEGVTSLVVNFYKKYTSESNIVKKFDIPAEHSWITDNYGNACSRLGTPYINNCNFDSAGAILQHIYGPLSPKVQPIQDNVFKFNQTQYTINKVNPSSLSLDSHGFAYVPTNCQHGQKCRLHITFHGCNQQYDAIGMAFVTHAGFNDWAESNNIIIVYPQTIASFLMPQNPQGCWDWWGYLNGNYATRNGAQVAFIQNIINGFHLD